jgi:hypothetical protein
MDGFFVFDHFDHRIIVLFCQIYYLLDILVVIVIFISHKFKRGFYDTRSTIIKTTYVDGDN